MAHRVNTKCKDCKVDVFKNDEYSYMLNDDVWAKTGIGFAYDDGKLCVGCTEKRLGRRLKPGDFQRGNPLNDGWGRQSNRLRSRLRGVPESRQVVDTIFRSVA